MKLKKVFKIWWGWDPGRIERYLEDMAAEGWKLMTVEFYQMLFGFISEKPAKTSYCVDYNDKPNAEYLSIIKDDGWELVNKCGGWILWRKDYEGSRPEIFTDVQSLIDRNKRLMIPLLIALVLQIPILRIIFKGQGYLGSPILTVMIFAIYIPLIALLLFGIIMILISNHHLKKNRIR